jgi:hypothetical protein
MYKTMNKGQPVAKDDPWAFCRNADCELYGQDQSGSAPSNYALDAGQAEKKSKKTVDKKAPEAKKTKEKEKAKKTVEKDAKPEVKIGKKKKRAEKAKKSVELEPEVPEDETEPETDSEDETESTPETETKTAAKDNKIRKALLSGKYSQAEIAFTCKVSRNRVRKVRNDLQDQGLL